jgi:uncharacterized protein (DUF1499 family)
MIIIEGMFWFALAVCGLFILLGLKSQKGQASGLVNGRLAAAGNAPNCVVSEAGTPSERAIAPLNSSLEQAKQAVVKTGGIITAQTDSYISATYMSRIFKFVDDVELRAAENGIVHIRSASRVGYSDRGANRKRAERIRAAL